MYTLNFSNESQGNTTFVVFQKYPNADQMGLRSLAWHARELPPTAQSNLNWDIDYSFVWGETGTLHAGVQFNTSQSVPSDPNSANTVSFKADSGSFVLENSHQEMPGQQLIIQEDPSIPLNQLAVGIGMSGKATSIIQAEPNMMLEIDAEPEYWVGIGRFKEGQVIDASIMHPLTRINFSGGAQTLKVTLSDTMMLSVS
jgi:hypothetical protein